MSGRLTILSTITNLLPAWRSQYLLRCPHVLRCNFANMLSEVPAVPFWTYDPVPAIAIRLVFGFFQNLGARLSSTLEVCIDVVHIHIEILSHVTEPLRVLILGPRAPDHNDAVGYPHFGVDGFPVRSRNSRAFHEAKSARQPVDGTTNVFIKEIGCNSRDILRGIQGHGTLLIRYQEPTT